MPETDEDEEHQVEPQSDDQQEELVVVIVAYAVVSKWAVMVKSVNALVTVVAVVGVLWSDDFTLWAQVSWVEVLVQSQE